MPELAWVVIITVSKRDPIIPQIKLHLLQADTRTKTRVKYSENKNGRSPILKGLRPYIHISLCMN